MDAVAKDGIQLKVSARVTVRSNLQQLIGGATEETIIARVGEGIVSAIGSAATHKSVLENPDMISKAVLARRLDSQTAFEIVSIDIADIDVGDNIGDCERTKLKPTRRCKSRAEGRRALAVARNENEAAIQGKQIEIG
ncbi:MAG: flotillin-like FloA family protein [Pirellulaceae bacterium]